MLSNTLIYPMLVQVGWTTFLYVLLTIVRAPTAWGVGRHADCTNSWASVEPRVSANLRNQFEWPMLFYVVCLLLLIERQVVDPFQVWLAWTFIAGRIVHSAVQILTTNVRLRGVVFTINFVAVLGMWGRLIYVSLNAES